MAEENKITDEGDLITADGAPEEKSASSLINEKLTSAAEAMTRADAENKIRLQEEKKQKEQTEKLNATQLEESNKRRMAELAQREAEKQKREAELSYAENYRKKIRAEKERAALAAERKKAQKRRAEDEAKKKAAEDEAMLIAAARELAEAEKRNAESDDLLRRIAERTNESNADTESSATMAESMPVSAVKADTVVPSSTTEPADEESYILNIGEDSLVDDEKMTLNIEGTTISQVQHEPIYDLNAIYAAGVAAGIGAGGAAYGSRAYPYSNSATATCPTSFTDVNGNEVTLTPDETARASELQAKKTALLKTLRDTETAYGNEISALQDKEHLAKKNALQNELAQKEALYNSEIADLNARLQEMEQAHNLKKDELVNSIMNYESSYYTGTTEQGESKTDYANEQVLHEYDELSLAERYSNKPTYDDYGKKTISASTEEDSIESTLDTQSEVTELERMTKRDLKDQLSKSAKSEARLIAKRKKLERKMRHKKGDTLARLYVEYLAISKSIIESYIADYRACIAVNDKKSSKKYAKRIESEIILYNSDIESYGLLTGYVAHKIPDTLTDDIANGKLIYSIPEVIYHPALSTPLTELPESDAPSKNDILKEQEQFLKSEEERNRSTSKKSITEIEPTADKEAYVPSEDVLTQIKTDADTVNARIEYRINKLTDDVSVTKFKFGEQTVKDRKTRKNAVSLVKAMKKGKKTVIRVEEKNNLRYLKIAECDLNTATLNGRADKRRMELLRERIISLLAQRDEINSKLLTLYNENDETVSKSGKNMRKKYSAIRLKATKKAYKKQQRTYLVISRLRITLKDKQKIYDVMNKRIELAAYLAECEYRLKQEKPKGAAKKTLMSEIKSAKRNVKYADKDIAVMTKKATKRSKKMPNPKTQLTWLLVLVIIIGAGVACYIFREQIFAWVVGLISSMKG